MAENGYGTSKNEVIPMVDLSPRTIQRLFEEQIRELTLRTIYPQEEAFEHSLVRGWIV